MTADRFSAPKADALPGCATPRTAETLASSAASSPSVNPVRGNQRRNVAGTGEQSPELSPNPVFEARPDDKGRFDELVAYFADGMVHAEMMSNKSIYIGFTWDDGRHVQFWLSSDKRLNAHHETWDGPPPKFTAQQCRESTPSIATLSSQGQSR